MARTRAADFEEKQRAILGSAAQVLAEQGMDKASMAQIAARAQVSKALLYHYYPGKAALIFDIIRSHLEELEDAVARADRCDLPPRDRLRLLVRATLAAYRDADDKHKVQLNGTPTLPEAARAEIHAIERRIVRRFAEVLRAVRPDLAGGTPLLLPVTMSLFGMMNWVYMWFREGGPITRAGYADLATDLILSGIDGLESGSDYGDSS
ncbi:TetR family transcriptional regulator [Pararhodobacter sp. SW119]|uniref:TetR/AcrR family transcriptional regulator n=1 Tax=Pararhodobacter sp. SW119 TaxID=2780075 RepID=UPI001ADFBA1C|nr:TetR family transcriptional regulator [Pararhodobacter sp. SW119]